MSYRLDRYKYDIDTVDAGDRIPIICDHKDCHRFLVAIVINPSVMYCHCVAYNSKFDMRNQIWKCFQHRDDAISKRDKKINKILK